MTLPQKDHLQVHNAIINGSYPTKEITLGSTEFVILFTPQSIPEHLVDTLDFFAPLIKIKGVDKTYGGKDILSLVPASMFLILLAEYITFQKKVMTDLRGSIGEYIKTIESKNMWALFKQLGPSKLFYNSDFPNILQRDWILWNLNNDKTELYELIKVVMENLQPWLNLELYTKLKQQEETTRSNWMYDDTEKLDLELQKQADRMLKEKKSKEVELDDLDIIELEETQ